MESFLAAQVKLIPEMSTLLQKRYQYSSNNPTDKRDWTTSFR